MAATRIISNDDLYTQYPNAHRFAVESGEFPEITEASYPAVESWEVVDEEPVTAIIKPIFADWYTAKDHPDDSDN